MTTKLIHEPFADARTASLDPSHRGDAHAAGCRASRPLLSVITIAVLVLTGGCAGTDSAGNGASTAHSDAGEHSDQGTVGLPSPHVHGVAVNPGDGRVYLATHHGLFRYDDTGPTRVGPVIDLMGSPWPARTASTPPDTPAKAPTCPIPSGCWKAATPA